MATSEMKRLLQWVAIAGAALCITAIVCVVWWNQPSPNSPRKNITQTVVNGNIGGSQATKLNPEIEHLNRSKHLEETTALRSAVNYSQETILSRHQETILPASVLLDSAAILSSKSLPTNAAYFPEVGNGHLATVVQSDTIFMNGLYNGRNITSHRARIPSRSGYSINWTQPSELDSLYSLDLGRGIFSEIFTGNGVIITLRTYAHRYLPTVMVNELTMTRQNLSTDVSVNVTMNRGQPSEDVDITMDKHGILYGTTKEAEYPELASIVEFYIITSASIEGMLTLSPGFLSETFVALTSIDVNMTNAVEQYERARSYFMDGTLLSRHVREWNFAWQSGRIDVAGNITIAKLNYACLYYLMSSLPFTSNREEWPFVGLSPGGLAHGMANMDYLGHVFWDQDTWMFPPIALLHSDMGRTLVQTRTRTLNASLLLAERNGDEGAKYPWESAYTGLETCPAQPYGRLEIHIIGDVALMFKQYWQLTHDVDLMVNKSGADVVWETAKYWAARATYSHIDDTFRILGVMPPDEFNYPVNDSVYTNSIAAINLKFANQLSKQLGKPVNQTWNSVGNKMRILYDPQTDFHPEFDGFSIHRHHPKQADVVLLGFPLMVSMNTSTRKNDLMIYEEITVSGPAMTWGMFLLGWLELDNKTKAEELYSKAVANAQEPFLVWSEYANGEGATNFLTGMGGYLQLVLFGYGGCRIRDNMLTFDPVLIHGTTQLTFVGIDYRGSSFNLRYSIDRLELNQTSVSRGSTGLAVRFRESKVWLNMVTGVAIERKRQFFYVRSRS